MLLSATEDTETLLHQGKGNIDAFRAQMIFVCTLKTIVLCLAGTYDCQITGGLPRASHLEG